jgi:hypothetical protein
MRNKEIILILAYCNTKEKKNMLFNLLNGLQKYRDNYDIMIASHIPLDVLFFDYFDYYYFDKNNNILTDIEYRQNSWFSPTGSDYTIWSNYTEVGNTLGAILDMLVPSISVIEKLGHKKIHYFEYDSIVSSDFELIENSKLLDEYDYVIYNNEVYGDEHSHEIIGGFLSFKTNSIVDEWKKLGEDVLKDLFFDVYPKIPENILFNSIKKSRTYIRKNFDELSEKGIQSALIRGNDLIWNVPIFDPKRNKLLLFCRNTSDSDYEIQVIVDGVLKDFGKVLPNYWRTYDISENFDNVSELIIFTNHEKILKFDFNDSEYKRLFKKYNFIEYNIK